LTQAGEFLDVSEAPRAVDYVLVLGGGNDSRPFMAAALVKARLAREVLIPKIKRSLAVEDGIVPPEEVIVRRVLMQRGVPESAILYLGEGCSSTEEEARALKEFLETRPNCSVAIVTSTYHTRRARSLFRKVLREQAAQLSFVGTPTDGFDAHNWWHFENGFACYMTEYFKFVYHAFRA
jgi:uncharacterized SAM-binding protein YcdF (DUF218 family)